MEENFEKTNEEQIRRNNNNNSIKNKETKGMTVMTLMTMEMIPMHRHAEITAMTTMLANNKLGKQSWQRGRYKRREEHVGTLTWTSVKPACVSDINHHLSKKINKHDPSMSPSPPRPNPPALSKRHSLLF